MSRYLIYLESVNATPSKARTLKTQYSQRRDSPDYFTGVLRGRHRETGSHPGRGGPEVEVEEMYHSPGMLATVRDATGNAWVLLFSVTSGETLPGPK